MTGAEMVADIRRIGRLYERALLTVREEYGLAQPEADVLGFLHNNPGLDTASQITEYRLLPKANVSLAVEALTRRGYVEARRDAGDRRRVHLALTPAAEEAARAIGKAQRAFFGDLFSGFSAEELVIYERLSHRIVQNVTDALEKRK